MSSRKLSILFTFALGLLALFVPMNAVAGGWAVITLDELPLNPVAGEPLSIGFTVLQHGRTPMDNLTPSITLENPANSEPIMVNARPEGAPGHYTAELVFPTEGTWDWSIQAFTMDQPMPSLAVSPDRQASVAKQTASTFGLPLIFGAFSLVCVGGALLLLVRTRPRWALALLAAGLLAGGVGFAFAAGQPDVSSSPPADVLNPVESGQRLFMAKGCTTCHANDQVTRDRDGAIYVDIGPDLSDFSADPEYLRRWLDNPASIKPGTEMPDLNLNPSEIEALVGFLNSK